MRHSLFLLSSTLFLLSTLATAHDCDAETECPDEETCCKLGDNVWGCCPMTDAVCCDDRTHCCPSGTVCDSRGARCRSTSTDEHFPMQKKKAARKTVQRNEFNEVICPDRSSKCPDGSTCCLLEQGAYGCCPVPHAVCCADMLHCCPNGFQCHGQFCSQNYARIPHLKKFASTAIHRKPAVEFLSEEDVEEEKEEEEEDDDEQESSESSSSSSSSSSSESDERRHDVDVDPIACGTGKTCPAKTTCCTIKGEDGEPKPMCCPLSDAVCCQSTCCPSGYHCVSGGKCEKHAKSQDRRFWSTDDGF